MSDLDPTYIATSESILICLRCQYKQKIDPCTNCGQTEKFFVRKDTYTSSGQVGSVRCDKCDRAWNSWKCPECGTQNPVSRSIDVNTCTLKCFIATAAYGSPLAPEVAVLRRFRDTKLQMNSIGRVSILLYERLSPPLAEAISNRPIARLIVRRIFLAPAVWLVRLFMPTEAE